MVTGPDGPLGGAVVTATTGTTTVETVSLTEGTVGEFILRGLVTPATYSVTVSSPGFSPQTTSVSLADGQRLTGVQLALARSSGSLFGVVTTLPGNAPAPGVTVTVTAGTATVQTVTQSTGTVGGWTIAGLAIPSPYTVTFSRPDLESQTVAVTLDAAGNLSRRRFGGRSERHQRGDDVGVRQRVREWSASAAPTAARSPVGEAVVTLTSGADTYTRDQRIGAGRQRSVPTRSAGSCPARTRCRSAAAGPPRPASSSPSSPVRRWSTTRC